MAAEFPTSSKEFTTKQDGVDKIHAAHINDIQNEVTAVEQALLGEIPDGNMQYVKKPATSTDNAIPRFDGTDGKKIQNSGVTVDDDNNIMIGEMPVPTSVATSTDNAIPRFDGTDGKKIQNSGVMIDDSNNIMVGSAPVPTSVATSTDNAIPRFDGTDGKKIQNSGVTIDDDNNIMIGEAPVPTSVTTSTDNAVPRFDGTDGKKIQNSGVTIDDDNNIMIGEMPVPTSVATSTDNAIPRFDGTDGKKIQNSGVMIDDSNNIMVGSAPVPTSVATSTDNAVPRFDGTDGKKIQNSGVIINDNGQLSGNGLDGWIYDTDTWSYVSTTSFKVSGKDVRYKFPKGTKIKLVQSGTTKYFYVTAATFSTDTTITITGGSDYTLASATISGQAYSYADSPQNYPFSTVAIRVERSTNQSIPNNAWTALSFDTIITEEKPATTSQWSSGSPTRLTCRLPGYYLVNAHIRFAANATGARGINIVKNGSDAIIGNIYGAFSGVDAHLQCTAIVKLETGDYIETKVYQNSDGALNAAALSNNIFFEWIRLGI